MAGWTRALLIATWTQCSATCCDFCSLDIDGNSVDVVAAAAVVVLVF